MKKADLKKKYLVELKITEKLILNILKGRRACSCMRKQSVRKVKFILEKGKRDIQDRVR